tara:strand:- start:11652 stop:13433 length:1782 start_codon:yes stop_codon:yes gene_type:complete
MRILNTDHWEEQNDGLLFFAQLIDEMLFDYTLDSYKPLALNSRLLCIEVFETTEEIRNGYIPKKNLQSVLEELVWSLNQDIAVKRILGQKFKNYLNQINPSNFKLNQTENIVRFIYNLLNERKYLEEIKKCLIELISEGKQKNKIKSLTNSFVSELINYGYNPNHIYYQNINFFFNVDKREKILCHEDLNDFFKIFDFEKKSFTVVFIGGIIFRHFRDTLNSFDIVVTKTYKCFSKLKDDLAFERSRKNDQSFVICSNVYGFDHHSAKEKAESLIGQITSIFNFYHHKEKPEIMDKCVVQRNDDNYVVIIEKATKAVLKTKTDESPSDAAKSVELALSQLKLSSESTYRFSRSIDLHGAALTSNAIENQLLDFWAALETLLPKDSESNKDRIVQICDGLVPFLQINYLSKIINELYLDLIQWNKTKINQIFNKINNHESYTDLEKTAALISLDSCKELRMELYALLGGFPLLKNRVYSLHETLSSPKSIKKVLDSHMVKINWHIRRIYRTRGLIIHSGKYPTYTAILIENLHNYLDLFLKRIIDLSIQGMIKSIEQGVFETQTALSFQLGLLESHENEELNESNFKEALLGEI